MNIHVRCVFRKMLTGLILNLITTQGDLTPSESLQLSSDLRQVFRGYGDAKGFECEPALRDILYKPFWKPRESSPCLLPGLSLLADTCGRVPR